MSTFYFALHNEIPNISVLNRTVLKRVFAFCMFGEPGMLNTFVEGCESVTNTINVCKNKFTSSSCVIRPMTKCEPSFSNDPNLGPYMCTKRTLRGAFLPEHDKMRGYCNSARSTPAFVINVLS